MFFVGKYEVLVEVKGFKSELSNMFIKKNIMLKDMDRRNHNCIEIHVFTHERITKLVERN